MKFNGNITNAKSFRTHTSFSPEDILAAGGTTAFGLKTGKNNQKLIEVLENTPKAEPFTKDEWDNLLIQLEKDK